ncbi:hypothetical protein TorRG33x02_074750, partial [Trema orientale]
MPALSKKVICTPSARNMEVKAQDISLLWAKELVGLPLQVVESDALVVVTSKNKIDSIILSLVTSLGMTVIHCLYSL